MIAWIYASGNYSRLYVCFVFSRAAGFCFLQLIIPSTAVVITSWVSLWMENETSFQVGCILYSWSVRADVLILRKLLVATLCSFQDMISIILTITFLLFSYNEVMPRVSYIKAMDIYLGSFLICLKYYHPPRCPLVKQFQLNHSFNEIKPSRTFDTLLIVFSVFHAYFANSKNWVTKFILNLSLFLWWFSFEPINARYWIFHDVDPDIRYTFVIASFCTIKCSDPRSQVKMQRRKMADLFQISDSRTDDSAKWNSRNFSS